MTRFESILAAAVLATIVGVVPASAVVNVKFVGSGSSAMFQQFSLAAFNGLCSANDTNCGHYSAKGKAGSGSNFAQAFDQRSASIPVEAGSLWVVYGTAANGDTDVWAYLTLDSILGNRCFFAAPRCLLQIDSSVQTTAGQNLILAALFTLNTPDSATLPANVFTALNGHVMTAGTTDIVLKMRSLCRAASFRFSTPPPMLAWAMALAA